MADECPHARLEHWYGMRNGEWEHKGTCMKCHKVFGPFRSWEQVRLAAGRPLTKDKKQAQDAKYRACVEALKDAREVLDVGGARYILGVDEAMVLIKKIDAALAGMEG